MQNLIIATGHSRTDKIWTNLELTWTELINKLQNTTRTPETQAEYFKMAKLEQDRIKDVGGFVGGSLKNGRRKADTIDKRYLLTLDADFATEDFLEAVDMFSDFSWCIYSTHKHTTEKPRLRLVIPLSRPCDPDEYEAVARKIAEEIGIDMFDDTTYQAHRLMYWPSTSYDGDYVFGHDKNKTVRPLNVDNVLARYKDWHDVSSWPTSSRVNKTRERQLKRQEDPTTKNGIIGAFCRTYTVYDVIDKFLPDIYIPCNVVTRYTYALGSSAAGVVIYEDGKFSYSNHATDPTSGMLCNAFDLVRIHKFGYMDEKADENTPVSKLPSFVKMQEFAAKDDNVKITLYKEKMQEASKDFEGMSEDEESSEWVLKLDANSKGVYASTIDNVKIILENDSQLKEKIRFNEFTKKYKIFGSLPWDKNDKERDWLDSDDAGLRHYLETYDIKGRSIIEDGWTLVANENRFHPVRDYLNSLEWDGQKRVDTLFIDYLGAEDNDYIRAVTRMSIVAAVTRIFVPGVKYDTMLVLVGPQGCGKSQIIKNLGGEWFSDTLTTVVGKEAYEQIQGFWVIEIAELAAMKKTEIEAIKHFTTKGEDAYRAAYGHHVETYKRQCVFFGTTNKYEFLRDMTGNRRFWPVDVYPERATKSLWFEMGKDVVDQVWAEAVEMFKHGEKIYISDEKVKALAEEEQDRHLEESPLAGDVKQYLDMKLPKGWDEYDLSTRRGYYNGNDFGVKAEGTVIRDRVCALEIWCEMFNGDKKEFKRATSREISEIILKTGRWEQMRTNSRFGDLYGTQRGFYRKGYLNLVNNVNKEVIENVDKNNVEKSMD